MTNKPKLGKIVLVVFLTILIWVWADLAQDDRLPLVDKVTITIAPSSDQAGYVVLKKGENGRPSLSALLDSVSLKGPVKRISEVRFMRDKGTLALSLYLDTRRTGLEAEGTHDFDVLSFLQQNDQIRQLGVSVEDCSPRKLMVQTQRLERKWLELQCVDANDHVVNAEMDPTKVEASVPGDEVRIAKIRLSPAELESAKTTAIWGIPFVEFGPGDLRKVTTRVKVKLPSPEKNLAEYQIPATLGFCLSTNLQGKYQVVLENEGDFESIFIRATPAAKEEFSTRSFPIILYVLDADRQATDFMEREVVFNFPQEYVLRGEIREGLTLPRKARFKVVPVTPEIKPAAAR